jgi:rhodanese-related sulfurtransferase
MFFASPTTPNPKNTSVGEDSAISAQAAYALTAKGEILLIDIRTQAEWCRTGVPENCHLVPMEDPRNAAGFVEAVTAEVEGRMHTPLALICRTGRRSAIAGTALIEGGFSHVFDVREGIEGGSHGRGWLAHGLPVGDHCCCVALGMDEDDCRC